MAVSSIVTDEHLPVINSALDKIGRAEKELDLATRAGLHKLPGGESLNTAGQKLAEAKTNLLNIKQVYFPGQ